MRSLPVLTSNAPLLPDADPLTAGRVAVTWHSSLLVVGLGGLLAGLPVGVVAGETASARLNHARGACIALELAAAHGTLDDAAYRRIVRSLAQPLNPHWDKFTTSHGRMLEVCGSIRPQSRSAAAPVHRDE